MGCLCCQPSLHLGPKGTLSWEELEGPTSPLQAPPCTLPYLSPTARNLVFLLPIYYDCICAPATTPPMGGRGGVQGPACSTFSTVELYQIKSLLFVQFFTASIPGCFLSGEFSMLAMAETARLSPVKPSDLRTLEPNYKCCDLISFPEV